jgi:hypothetical protein
MASSQLFEVASAEAGAMPVKVSTSAVGMASQMEVVAELLRLGHKVAVPVVDDDGVDLVVNYSVKVQVKFTSLTTPNGLPILTAGRMVRARKGGPLKWRTVQSHVDVLVCVVAGVGVYVMPVEVVLKKRNVSLGPSMDQWREAWSVFDASR